VSLLKNEAFVLCNHPYLAVKPFKELNDRLIVGFSTRKKGFSIESYRSLNFGLHVQDEESSVIANRNKLADELQIPLNRWVISEQVHGSNLKKVSEKDCGSGALQMSSAIKETDGLYTGEKNVLLVSLYADCVPLYFYSATNKVVGLAHAGWKGTVAKIGPKMVQTWIDEEGIPLDSIYVAIGPSIGQESYQVDDHVINKVLEVIPTGMKKPFQETNCGKYLLDLKELNKQLLINVGIKPEQIFLSNYCTYKQAELFFSYRRKQQTGRMISFIGRT
jgi:YfiH family protein